MGLRQVRAPQEEPVDISWLRSHVRDDLGLEDHLLRSYIRAARMEVERLSGETLITQSWALTLCRFPVGRQAILLPKKPILSITSVNYVDLAGASQTFGTLDGSPEVIQEYRLIQDEERPLLALNLNYDWPIAASVDHAVEVEFVAGYGETGMDVPERFKAGIAMLAAYYNQNREDTIETPQFVRSFLGVPKVG